MPRASAALQLRARIFRVIPPALAVIPVPVSSAHSVVDAIVVVEAAQTAVVAVPTVVQTAGARPARDSNAGLAEARGMTAVTVAIPVRRGARSSSPKC